VFFKFGKKDFKTILILNGHLQKFKDLRQLNNNLLSTIPYNHRTQAIEGFFNVLKSKLAKKKSLTYERLCENTENVLKEIPQKTYQNLIWGYYFKFYKSN
jgi:hypothetical protein